MSVRSQPLHNVRRSFAAAAAALLLSAGCGTIQQPYIPSTVGVIATEQSQGPIEVQIVSSQDTVTLGDPIYFTVIIRNTGERPLWLPRNPHVMLTWVYPNGRRDNFLREFAPEGYFSKQDSVLLHPGQQMLRTIAVKTYYFPHAGITEFRAVVHSPLNTNSELQPFWSGQAESNAFGVKVLAPKKKKGSYQASGSIVPFGRAALPVG
jgi:hypothetical protein